MRHWFFKIYFYNVIWSAAFFGNGAVKGNFNPLTSQEWSSTSKGVLTIQEAAFQCSSINSSPDKSEQTFLRRHHIWLDPPMSKLVCGHLSPCWGPPPQWGFPGSLRSPWLRCWRSTSWGTCRGTRLWLLAPQLVASLLLEGEKTFAGVGNELQWRERQGWKDLFLKYKRREHPVRGDKNPHVSAHSLKIKARCWRRARTRTHCSSFAVSGSSLQ